MGRDGAALLWLVVLPCAVLDAKKTQDARQSKRGVKEIRVCLLASLILLCLVANNVVSLLEIVFEHVDLFSHDRDDRENDNDTTERYRSHSRS
jgi:hypothetical protein